MGQTRAPLAAASAAFTGESVPMPAVPYYRTDLARVHHEGFGFHADAVAPGVLRVLEPVLERGGLVLEIGCGSGLLTRYLVEAGHRVLATDASPAMLEIARDYAPGVEALDQLRLPDDPAPAADAIVSVGHPLSYLDDEEQVRVSLTAIGRALLPGGVLAFDICDFEWGEARRDQAPRVWSGDDWVLITRTSVPDRGIYRRHMTTFVRETDELWRRDTEVHDNVLIATDQIPALLATTGVEADIRASFGDETLPRGLVAVVGRRAG
jgi:SAM-dependent methyltransferase